MLKNHPHKQVIYWLLTGCVLIYVMVVVGCITRLTHSGLSITDWSVMGTMPPLSEQSWTEHFARYQASPEFQIVNSYMKLDEFKSIFWWEWSHRMIGRLIGFVFFAGFVYFLVTKKFTRKLLIKSIILLCVGALQGLVGWWMVKSGLVKNPNVSHYRLATHLMTAFTAFAFSFWFAMELIFENKNENGENDGKKLFSATLMMSLTIIFQIIYGAFVAGLKAGKFYNTWPKMGDQWFQSDIIFSSDTLVKSFTENPAGVQFMHRTFAWVVVCAVVFIWMRAGKLKLNKWQNNGVSALVYLTTLQIILGIFTLIYNVPVLLGVLHQTVGFFLFATCLYLLFHFKSSDKKVMRKISIYSLLLLTGSILFSCVGEFKEISVSRIDGFKVTNLSPSGIDGEINVTINNPNNVSFKVYRSKATIMYGDMKLGTAHTVKKVKIGANSNVSQTFVLKGDLKDVSFAQLPALLMGKGAKMEIKGHIKAGKWFYKKKFPIDEKQRISGIDMKGGFPGL